MHGLSANMDLECAISFQNNTRMKTRFYDISDTISITFVLYVHDLNLHVALVWHFRYFPCFSTSYYAISNLLWPDFSSFVVVVCIVDVLCALSGFLGP